MALRDLSNLTYLPNGLAQGVTIIVGGAAGDHTVTGITTKDKILGVQAIEFNGGVPHDVHSIGDEFTITDDDTINNDGGTDTSDMFVFVHIAVAKS